MVHIDSIQSSPWEKKKQHMTIIKCALSTSPRYAVYLKDVCSRVGTVQCVPEPWQLDPCLACLWLGYCFSLKTISNKPNLSKISCKLTILWPCYPLPVLQRMWHSHRIHIRVFVHPNKSQHHQCPKKWHIFINKGFF